MLVLLAALALAVVVAAVKVGVDVLGDLVAAGVKVALNAAN